MKKEVDFDWNEDKESIIFPTVQGVAVYRNIDEKVIIRQQAGPLDNDDTCIILPENMAQELVLALQNELG